MSKWLCRICNGVDTDEYACERCQKICSATMEKQLRERLDKLKAGTHRICGCGGLTEHIVCVDCIWGNKLST